jgi:uncharacterized membrane protein
LREQDSHNVSFRQPDPLPGARCSLPAVRWPPPDARYNRRRRHASMNWIIKNFLRGLVILVPIVLTIYLLYEAFIRIDRLLDLPTPGLGFLVAFLVILGTGVLASNIFIRQLFTLTEWIFTKAPLVRIVYAAIKDLLEAFVGDKKRFNRPVAVALTSDASVRTLGFVTQEDLSFLSLPGLVAVYLPFCYSVAGSLVIVPAPQVQPLDADSAQVMALIVSGGVSRSSMTSA